MAQGELFDFTPSTKYKLIYIFAIGDEAHTGCLKIGDATLLSPKTYREIRPNSPELNDAAHARIAQYTKTAGISYRLLHTELAVRERVVGTGRAQSLYLESFKDTDIHAVLEHSGIAKKIFPHTRCREWFVTDLETAIAAIDAYKRMQRSLDSRHITHELPPIVLRDEQNDAVEKTLERFRKKNDMLWDAKMRFGKTLTALEVVRRSHNKEAYPHPFRRVLICTHRPVVSSGWHEDFKKTFRKTDACYEFIDKSTLGGNSYSAHEQSENDKTLRQYDKNGKNYIYFASVQDLRGSKLVGGKFDKNVAVFETDWDLIILDEAHEGLQTDLGDALTKKLIKKSTKVLSLSGTPFNILGQFDEEAVYVWDYVNEQKRKETWDDDHPGEPNPYADMPKMHILTYDIGRVMEQFSEEDLDGKAFNFREFFRTWTGDEEIDHRKMPRGAAVGDFVHAADVSAFLDLISRRDPDNRYPFATDETRDMFKHTLWMVPGVKEAKALSAMLKEHPVFGNFGIANVAGEGDDYEEAHYDDALKLVKNTIANHEYSITLSCGKLTTGVTVKEWTAVMLLAGSTTTAAAGYMQTIFRVQSAGSVGGRQKTDCYVFDFAPDRALRVLAETAQISRRVSKNDATEEHGRQVLGEFLNYCPVIAIEGSRMQTYDVKKMMQSIKHIFVMKAIKNGFDDNSIYSDKLLNLGKLDIKKFEKLRAIVGETKQTETADSVIVDAQGFDEEEREKGMKKPQRELTEEEKAERAERKRKREEKKRAISILRAISIRMPLLIYGADVPVDKIIKIGDFVRLVDQESWDEFMPTGVTKELFSEFVEYYDPDVFEAAGLEIRKLAKSADKLAPTQRVMQIARIFSYFKNPDKETVLTPWRVVNMHMSDTLGGWCFWDAKFEKPLEDGPRFVSQGEPTRRVLRNCEAKVLEINSKSGLYPLYVAYSLYRANLGSVPEDDITPKARLKIWNDVITNSLFVICKTPMASSITTRTLAGYTSTPINAKCFDNLVDVLHDKPDTFVKKVGKAQYWKKEGDAMEFDAVVGNPPYQQEVAKKQSETNGQARRKSIFQYFQTASDEIATEYVSLIYPGGRWIHRSGKGMEEFGLSQINDLHLCKVEFFPDAEEVFKSVAISDGISIVCKDMRKTECGFEFVYCKNGTTTSYHLDAPGEDLIPLNPRDGSVLEKVKKFTEENRVPSLNGKVLSQKLFGIESDFVEKNPKKVKPYEKQVINFEKEIKLFTNDKAGKAGRSQWYVVNRNVIPTSRERIDEWKVVVSSANAGGQKRDWQLAIFDNHSAFGRSRVALGSFKTKAEAEHFYEYCRTYLIRFLFRMTDESLTSLAKKVPDIGNYTSSNKFLDFSKDLNRQLYALMNLTKSEIEYVESTIKSIDASRSGRQG